MNSETLPIVVIGGGFSGTLAAIHLLRKIPGQPVLLIEERGEAGPGVAYQGSDASAWLNVPAGGMSAFPDDPDHFLRYARRTLGDGVQAEDFLPRRVYGTYLKDCLHQALEKYPRLKVEERQVVDLIGPEETGHPRVVFKDHSSIDAAAVVLATGNQGSAFSSSVWASHTLSARDAGALAQVKPGEDVLIIGSGLTMIDTVLDLDRRGDARIIHAISRNGLLPQPYAPASEIELPELDHLPDSNLRKSLRLFRRAVRDHQAKGGDWRDLFAAIRPATPSLWQELSARDRSRFLRWISPFWEVHRHQCPPETYERIQRFIANGKLVLHRGTIVTVERSGAGKRMGLAPRNRHAATRWLEVSQLFDATGPSRDIDAIEQPLIQNLRRRGFLRADAHRLGADVGPDYRAIGRGGKPSSWLYLVGPMLRSRFFEATAVHELRLHASAVASRLQHALAPQDEPQDDLAGVA